MTKPFSGKLKTKRFKVFSFEGKCNRTENIYFSHFKSADNQFMIKRFSSGKSDPPGMVKETKSKRRSFEYDASRDLTYVFMDTDCDKNRISQINELKKSSSRDLHIVVSHPCVEVWFLNHFEKVGKMMTSEQVKDRLKKYIPDYEKNKDVYSLLKLLREKAVLNSEFQDSLQNEHCYSEISKLFKNNVIIDID